MQFKDAAFEILKKENKPLHYNEITNRAIAAGLLESAGKTPHATMGVLIYIDKRNLKTDWTELLREEIRAGVRSAVKTVLRKKKVREEDLEPFLGSFMVQA